MLPAFFFRPYCCPQSIRSSFERTYSCGSTLGQPIRTQSQETDSFDSTYVYMHNTAKKTFNRCIPCDSFPTFEILAIKFLFIAYRSCTATNTRCARCFIASSSARPKCVQLRRGDPSIVFLGKQAVNFFSPNSNNQFLPPAGHVVFVCPPCLCAFNPVRLHPRIVD